MKRKHVSMWIDHEIYEKAMCMVFWTPGFSMGSLVEKLLEETVRQTELERGEPFLPRKKS